jgi:aminopeptidase N
VSVDHGSHLCASIEFPRTAGELAAQLRLDDDPIQRIRAGRALLPFCGDPEARDAFRSAALADPFYGVREQLMQALVRLNPDSISWKSELRKILLHALKDGRSSIRAAALGGLRALRDSTLADTFRIMTGDSSYYVAAGAMQCLADVAGPKSVPLLSAMLEVSSFHDVIALAALEIAGRMRAEEFIAPIARLAAPGGSPGLRTAAIHTLGLYGAAQLPRLASFLAEPALLIRETALRTIAGIPGDEARNLLQRQISGGVDPATRELAKRLLSR